MEAGESEQYLLSNDGEDEEEKILDTVEESQEAPVGNESSTDTSTDVEACNNAENVKDGGAESISPEEASPPPANPEQATLQLQDDEPSLEVKQEPLIEASIEEDPSDPPTSSKLFG